MLFLGAILWDFLLSGDQVTNQDSKAFSRDVRRLLYIGYTLVATSIFLYFVSQRIAGTGQVVPLNGTGAPLEVIGAEGLGLPLLAFTFIRALGRWRARGGAAGISSQATIGVKKSVSGSGR